MWLFRSNQTKVNDKVRANLQTLIDVVNKNGLLELEFSDHRSSDARAEWWRKGGPFQGVEDLMLKDVFRGKKPDAIANNILHLVRAEIDLGTFKHLKSTRKNKLECSYTFLLRNHIERRKTLQGGSDIELRNMILHNVSQAAIVNYLIKRHGHRKKKHLIKFLNDMLDKRVLNSDSKIGNKTLAQIAQLKGFEKLNDHLIKTAQKRKSEPDEVQWVG